MPPPGSGVVCEFISKIPQALFHVLQFRDLPVEPSGVSGPQGRGVSALKHVRTPADIS